MKNTPQLSITFVREKDGEYEYGLIKPIGVRRESLLPMGKVKSREEAHDRARKLMRLWIVK